MKGSRAAAIGLILALLIVLGATAYFLVASNSGTLDSGETKRVNERLSERSRQLRELQSQSNEKRALLSAAFEQLEKVFNLIRQPGGAGIEEAKKSWEGAPDAMEKARSAMKDLPDVTRQIVEEAGKSRVDIREVFPSISDESDVKYLEALDVALESLIQTELQYSRMNQRIETGFNLYEKLYSSSEAFFKALAAGQYRTNADAAKVYDIGTSALVEPLKTFRSELETLERAASSSGAKTTQAFKEAARFRS